MGTALKSQIPWFILSIALFAAIAGSGFFQVSFVTPGLSVVIAGVVAGRVVFEVEKRAAYPVVIGGANDKRQETSYSDAKAALDRMADWAKWLVGIQTAALAVIGIAPKSDWSGWLGAVHLAFGILAALFLGGSTYCFVWLLAAFPSVQQRLFFTKDGQRCKGNDVYAMNLFKGSGYNVQTAAGCSHYLGIVGFFCFAMYFMIGLEKYSTSPTTVVVQGVEKPLEFRMLRPSIVELPPGPANIPVPQTSPDPKPTLGTIGEGAAVSGVDGGGARSN